MKAFKISQQGIYSWISLAKNLEDLKKELNSFFVNQIVSSETTQEKTCLTLDNGIMLYVSEIELSEKPVLI